MSYFKVINMETKGKPQCLKFWGKESGLCYGNIVFTDNQLYKCKTFVKKSLPGQIKLHPINTAVFTEILETFGMIYLKIN